jgi:hypothetical protein
MDKRDLCMRKILFILVIFCYVSSHAQEKSPQEYFIKYFLGLDISRPYTDWVKSLEQNSSVIKPEIYDRELFDPVYINYKISDHPFISGDSIKAFLSYKLRINVDTIKRKILDSVFVIHLYFIYGKGKDAKKKMTTKFMMERKELSNLGKEYPTHGMYNNNFYYGYAYDFKNDPTFPYLTYPYLFTIAWTKNKSKEYILRLTYFIHFEN